MTLYDNCLTEDEYPALTMRTVHRDQRMQWKSSSLAIRPWKIEVIPFINDDLSTWNWQLDGLPPFADWDASHDEMPSFICYPECAPNSVANNFYAGFYVNALGDQLAVYVDLRDARSYSANYQRPRVRLLASHPERKGIWMAADGTHVYQYPWLRWSDLFDQYDVFGGERIPLARNLYYDGAGVVYTNSELTQAYRLFGTCLLYTSDAADE